jgi:hypothetical protein
LLHIRIVAGADAVVVQKDRFAPDGTETGSRIAVGRLHASADAELAHLTPPVQR